MAHGKIKKGFRRSHSTFASLRSGAGGKVEERGKFSDFNEAMGERWWELWQQAKKERKAFKKRNGGNEDDFGRGFENAGRKR